MRFSPILVIAGTSLLFVSCDKKAPQPQKPDQKTAEKVEKSIDQANQSTQKSAKKSGNALINAAQRIGEQREKSANDAQKTLNGITPAH